MTEAANKALSSEVQELQKRLGEVEEQAKAAERQKSLYQRLLQENKKRLVPLQLEIQKIIEKVTASPEELGQYFSQGTDTCGSISMSLTLAW